MEMNEKKIVLNYYKEDKVYAIPVMNILSHEEMDFIQIPRLQRGLDGVDKIGMLINIVTDNFLKNIRCRDILEDAVRQGIPIVSLKFCTVNNLAPDKFGEIMDISAIEGNDEYLMHSLYHKSLSALSRGKDPFYDQFKAILNNLHKKSRMSVGSRDKIILAVDSKGQDVIKEWLEQGVQINSRIVFVNAGYKAEMDCPDRDCAIENWNMNIANEPIEDIIYGSTIKKDIHDWLISNLTVNDTIIILGELGKGLASYLIPQILCQANHLKIQSSVICSVPPKQERKLGIESLMVISKMAGSVFWFDGVENCQTGEVEGLATEEWRKLYSYVTAFTVESCLLSAHKYGNMAKIVIRMKFKDDKSDEMPDIILERQEVGLNIRDYWEWR
ncbi:MAG: hypothetical protein E7294_01205 [Lachnospiraceae bacterium]|nr:hypothetical protein [Lachnospiraceae bacterium]